MRKLFAFFALLAVAVWAEVKEGETLVARWNLASGKLVDESGKYPLVLRGNTKNGEGIGLVPANTEESKSEGAWTKTVFPELAPKAFRLTATFSLSDDAFTYKRSMYIFDNKYLDYKHKQDKPEYNRGFMLLLVRLNENKFRLQGHIGHGVESEGFTGPDFIGKAGQKYTAVMEYDGIDVVTFTLDGKQVTKRALPIGGPVAPAFYETSIGDRSHSNFGHFQGNIYDVELVSLPIPEAIVTFPARKAFVRDEKIPGLDAKLAVNVMTPAKGKYGKAEFAINGRDAVVSSRIELDLSSGSAQFDLPVRTNLLPGSYDAYFEMKSLAGDKPVIANGKVQLLIAPQLSKEDQVRFFWLIGMPYYKETLNAGFTHAIHSGDLTPEERDRFLMDGFTFMKSCNYHNYRSMQFDKKYPRMLKNGEKYEKNIDVANPDAMAELRKLAEENAAQFERHPGFGGILASSEVRDRSVPSFTKYNADAYRAATGMEVPPEADDRKATNFTRLKNFPLGNIVPEDYPLLSYYRWFWKKGDGWNDYQSQNVAVFEKEFGRPLISVYDPAVRVPPLYGSGGNVKYLNQWTYIYPEPFNVSYVVSEQQSMARGKEGQGVYTMLQGISYRSAIAPKEMKVKNPPKWTEDRPNVVYMTTPPALLREGLWAIFSRELQGIGMYAWRSLFDAVPYGRDRLEAGYQFTNPDAIKVVDELYHRIAIPFGPLLKSVPERAPEVAVLESYASSILAGRGSWGWSGFIYDCGIMLTAANLSPYVLYEEEVAKGIPETIKVIFMPHCDVLTENTYEMLRKYQARGGIIVADDALAPAVVPDYMIPEFKRGLKADELKVEMQKAAAQTKKMLADYLSPYADANNLDIVTHVRTYKDADYLFAINDKREFGDYVGMYGKVLDKGCPNEGIVTVNRAAGAVYDLEKHALADFTVANGRTNIKVKYSDNDGKLFMITGKKLGKMSIGAPKDVKRGASFTVKVTSPDADAMLPVNLEIILPDGTKLDNSAYGIVKDGTLSRNVTVPQNVQPGTWSIRLTSLADGSVYSEKISIQ